MGSKSIQEWTKQKFLKAAFHLVNFTWSIVEYFVPNKFFWSYRKLLISIINTHTASILRVQTSELEIELRHDTYTLLLMQVGSCLSSIFKRFDYLLEYIMYS